MDLHLLCATETGHAFDLLRQFRDACQQRGLAVASFGVMDESIRFSRGLWVIFVSTTGQGAMPFSMRALWKQMMKKGYSIGEGTQFAIYSLGDRGYGDNFGVAGRKLRQRLRMLGAEEVVQIGLGDDQDAQGYREVYATGWRDRLLESLDGLIKKENGNCRENIREIGKLCSFEVVGVEEISNRKGRRVCWIEMQVNGGEVRQGDVLDIYPYNRVEDVNYLLQHFGRTGEQITTFFGKTLPLKEILLRYANVSSMLNYYFFSNSNKLKLVNSAQNQLYKGKLQQFGRDYEEYFNFVCKYKRNVVQFLKDFDIKLDLQYFLQNISLVIGRKYSVAKVKGNRIWLLMKLVQNQMTQGRLYKGLCSHDVLKVGVVRDCKILRGDVTPQQLRRGNILITLGTGIAPFVWAIDRIVNRNDKALIVYTNSYQDQIFHKRICQDYQKNVKEIISCTRQGGIKLLRLIEGSLSQIGQFLKEVGTGNARIFYCGPKEIQQFLTKCIASLLSVTPEQLIKSKLIVYQNW